MAYFLPHRGAYRASAAASLTALEHVPLRTQDSNVTRPGDMGTSSAKVNGLLRAPLRVGTRYSWRLTAGWRSAASPRDSRRPRIRHKHFAYVIGYLRIATTCNSCFPTMLRGSSTSCDPRDSPPRDNEAIATPHNVPRFEYAWRVASCKILINKTKYDKKAFQKTF